MTEIIHQYGGFLIDALAFASLLALIFTGISDAEGRIGILDIVGNRLQTEEIKYYDYQDFDSYMSESAKSKPYIVYTMGVLDSGETMLTDCFEAYDGDGNRLDVRIISAENPGGIIIYPNDEGVYELEREGVYTLTVSAVDDGARKTVCEVTVPVQ